MVARGRQRLEGVACTESWARARDGALGRSHRDPGAEITRGCPAWLRTERTELGAPVRVGAPRKPPLGATCQAVKAAAAATVAVVRAVAAPPLSTRDAPHSPRQGPGAANHSRAGGEAPPPPGTSATSEEGERGEDAEGKNPGLAALPPSLGRPSVGVTLASGPGERCS